MKRRTSDALVEIRTVASRAETAMERIKRLPAQRAHTIAWGRDLEKRDGPGTHADPINLTGFYSKLAEDPEEPEMVAALEQAVALLERWR